MVQGRICYYLVLSVQHSRCRVDSIEDTPVPIPNTEVKLYSAESSWRIASCEDRTSRCFDYSELAQLVEHTTVNRVVVGSSPTFGVMPT